MKVILRSDVLNLGKVGDVVEVADGYARNYLIPQQKALFATKSRKKFFDDLKKNLIRKEQKIIDHHQNICNMLEKKTLIFSCKTGEKKQMFGAITSLNIQKKLESEGFDVQKIDIKIKEPLNKIGSYIVSIRLHPRIMANLKVELIEDK